MDSRPSYISWDQRSSFGVKMCGIVILSNVRFVQIQDAGSVLWVNIKLDHVAHLVRRPSGSLKETHASY